jgi:hypothetical protein
MYALSYSLAHLAVQYGGRQDARLEPKYKQHVEEVEVVATCASLGTAFFSQHQDSI